MIIYLTTDAPVAGNVWPKGTRLSAPDAAAMAAVRDGVATFEPPTEKQPAQVGNEVEDDAPKRRGRPPKA